MVIGLTGGIGCGKTLAARFFVQQGFVAVDADQLARQVLESPSVCALLRACWGAEALLPDGMPNRAWIAAKVFTDPNERTFLESITHPEVSRLRQEAIADPSRNYIVEIPLLFEKNLAAEFKAVVCVACSESVRLQRLQGRGVSLEEAKRRIASQLPLDEKVKKSDYVLWNDGDAVFLERQVQKLVAQLV
jgi:dephospho-CoA kinase